MASYFDNVETAFASSVNSQTMPRWQRKAMENVNTSTTPKKTPRKDGDRFIPNRAMMNLESAQFHLTSADDTSDATMADEVNAKILAFKTKAPQPKQGHKNDLRVLYTQNRSAPTTKKSTRVIPNAPDRVLDAPEMRPDFYLNLLDWGSNNMIAVALDTAVYLWNASTGETMELCHTSTPGDYISSVRWAGDGTHIAVSTADAKMQIWDATTQSKLRTMTGHSGRVGCMDWNEHILSSGSASGLIMNSDVRIASHTVGTLQGHSQEVCGLKWSPDGKLLASGGNDNLVNIWTAAGEQRHTLTDHQAAVKALDWCPWQSNLLASGGGTADRHIRFWNTTTGNCLNSIDTESQVSSLIWNEEHKEIVSGHGFANNQLSIWKYPSLAKVAELTGHTDRVLSMAVSPDGQAVASAAGDETLRIWKCFASDAKKAKKRVQPSGSIMGAMIR
eukprot:TRINITY_DN26978_c0_g1_i1.p1 TRINITY_DN26978_c0_g1~~TRINITY_DN26978_c0_g1_i1.p1  ORF type:complete len:446 (+),score=139.86 TRINITY_DN26978_c0_g1_i1:76-1413(+)